MATNGEAPTDDASGGRPPAEIAAADVSDPACATTDTGATGSTGGRLAGVRWFLAFLGACGTSLLGLVTAFVAAMGCTDCSSNERKLQAAFALTALASGPAIGLVGLWAADRGWRPWLIWAGVVAASLIGVNNLLWSTSYGR